MEDHGFQSFLKVVDPKYMPPSRRTIMRNHLPSLYEEKKAKLMAEISQIDWFSLTTDLWTSRATQGYMTVTCHYLTKDWELKSAVLETVHIAVSHTADNLASALDSIIQNWNISDKIVCVVTDGARNITAALRLKQLKHLYCFAHTINLIVTHALKSDEDIVDLRKKCRDVVSYFHMSSKGSDKLALIQKQLGLEQHKLIQEVDTRWNSTYYMFQRMVEQHDAVTTALCLLDQKQLCLSTTLRDTMKELVEILKPFEAVTREVSSDKYISSSKIIPLARSLQKLTGFKGALSDKVYETLSGEMRKRFLGIESHLTLAPSTILDPRFKKLAFGDDGAVDKVLRSIEGEMLAMATCHSDKEIEEIEPDNITDQSCMYALEEVTLEVGNCGSDEGLWQFLDERVAQTSQRCTPIVDIKLEVDRYMKMKNIERKDDPLNWWNFNSTVCPYLSQLARKYLSVPGTSVPAERLFSKAGELISTKRSRLKPKNIDIFLFLNTNL